MKLRKRPAQPLNLLAVDPAAPAQGPGQTLTPPTLTPGPASAADPHARATGSAVAETARWESQDSGAPAPWPSSLADSEWTSGWADPEADPLQVPPEPAVQGSELLDLSSMGPIEAAPDREGDLDRPPLRQALSSRTPPPPTGPPAGAPRTRSNRPAAAAPRNGDVKTRDLGDKTAARKRRPDRSAAEAPLGLLYTPPRAELGAARYAYLAAGMGAVLWSGSFIAFMLAFQKGVAPLTYVPFQSTILAVLTVLPAAFMILAAYAIRQGARMATEARTARRLAEDMVLPAAQAASETTSVLEAVRREVDRAAGATRIALEEISVLRDALTQETDRLTEAAGDAQRTARIVGDTLANERDEIAQLSRELRSNAEDVAAAVSQQTQLVADASDLARSQLQEAEAALVARAADLTAATAATSAAAQDAGERLAHQTQFLDATGAALAERLRILDARLSEQREGLGALVDRCHEDQDEIAARLESRRAQLIDAVAQARLGATELTESSGDGVETLRELIAAVADQMRDLVRTAEAERAALSQTAADTYAAVADQARYAQETASAHVETAKVQVEQLGQLAFDAGQRANQAFEGRISEARHLIEQSAALVEDAGLRSAARIEVGVAASRSALEDLSHALADLDSRISKLPEEARTQADGVTAAVEQAAADLAAAVRKLSLETKAVDDSFQARVRKSYETLKAYEPLGGAAKSTEQAAAGAPAAPAPTLQALKPQEVRPDPADIEALRRTLAAEETEEDDIGASAFRSARAEVGDAKTAAPAALGLRQRLRLTPTEADTALKSVFDPLQGRQRQTAPPRMFADRADRAASERAADERAAGERAMPRAFDPDVDEWTWKDLLSSIDETPATDDALAGLMIEEINALGVDAGALLPRGRLDEISAAAVSMGPSAVRDTVRRLAPAAVRRLSRRVLTDKVLKGQADRYLRRYLDLLQGSIEKDPSIVNTLLGSDPGRAYLLLDAAVGDLH